MAQRATPSREYVHLHFSAWNEAEHRVTTLGLLNLINFMVYGISLASVPYFRAHDNEKAFLHKLQSLRMHRMHKSTRNSSSHNWRLSSACCNKHHMQHATLQQSVCCVLNYFRLNIFYSAFQQKVYA